MKKLFFIVLVFYSVMFLVGCTNVAKVQEGYLRIHIRANSNLECDQNIKYKVKDQVVTFLTPLLASCDNLAQVKLVLQSNLTNIEQTANAVLSTHGFTYASKAKLNNEFFPTRCYDSVVLEADYYDALILELGTATGDNWWCVVYPPLCFVGNETQNTQTIVYKSKLLELIDKFFN